MSGDSMRITYLGHAGLRVDGADLRLLMDPWLSKTGAFQAAWYQFPAWPAGLRLRHRLA
jgi:L-ascorbate metabolism protein UlaG (beta-lactamase superfamily)